LAWDRVVRIPPATLESLAGRHGGTVLAGAGLTPQRLRPPAIAEAGDIAPLLVPRFVSAARRAVERGAVILARTDLAPAVAGAAGLWAHEHAAWILAQLLDTALAPDAPPIVGADCTIADTAVLGPRVELGARVRVGPGAVIGYPGFGWATGPSGAVRAVPQLAGVVIEDDVCIGPLCTIDAGTLVPTRVRRAVKLDAHVHVGHNVDIGMGSIIAAQCGFAGSVTIGAGVLIGGQVGVADHVTVGAGARIAAKSGVISDVPEGATVAGYPAVARGRWLRAWAKVFRSLGPVG
jgi:UDP-3-O-[3-hydroxymyristoyl] glucosamine N-acyltransferase